VSVRLNYRNRFGASLEGEQFDPSSVKIESINSLKQFHGTSMVTDIDVRIIPLKFNNNSTDLKMLSLPAGEINFDSQFIHSLLKDKKVSKLELILTEAMEDREIFDNFVLDLLSVIQLDNSDSGVHYSVAGAFSNPVYTSFPWPARINCDCDGINDADISLDDNDEQEIS
jgi:hypothetical protein